MSAFAQLQSHFDRLLEHGLATGGPDPAPMWLSAIDVQTGGYPADDRHAPGIEKRVYRNIDAPQGVSLYWDLPLLVAAHALSERSGEARYAEAADAYVQSYLARCTAGNGMLLWGNHYYWDVERGSVMRFVGEEEPQPIDPASDPGELHEIRPILPPWDLLALSDEAAVRKAVAAACAGHIADPDSGAFNRHADQKFSCAFLEAGASLTAALCWLAERSGEEEYAEQAERVAAFSCAHRNEHTGLIENNPTVTRWDKHCLSSEVGLWAGALLRCERPALEARAIAALDPWLERAWDAERGRYVGCLCVADGRAICAESGTPYQPGEFCDPWLALFPTHDYPMPCAEACLLLARAGEGEQFRLACERWLQHVAASLPARDGRGGYAEHYGRCLHFALGCRDAFGWPAAHELADRLAAEAVDRLWAGGMFRGHPGEDRCDAVDGLGYLALALLWHEQGARPEMYGLGW